LLCAATLASLSRGVLGLAVALAVASARSPARRAFAAFVTAAALLAMVTLSLGNLSLDPTRPAEARWLDAPSPRLQALATAGRTLWKHPLGSGPGSLPARVDGRPFEAHCTPLNVAATLGAPAALALLAMPVLLWRRRVRPLERSAWGALLGLGVDALAQDVEDFRHVWLLLGWLWGAARSDEPAGLP
jgi:hypothetical protein